MKKVIKTQAGRFVAGLVALLVLLGAVSAVQQLSFLKADITPQKLMTLSETSAELLKSLTEDVDIYYMATETGKEIWVDELIQRYDAASGHISYEMIDPASSKATDIASMANATLSENCLVIASDKRMISLTAENMYSTEYNQMYYYYYGEMIVESQYFMADSELANAIRYVTRDDLPVAYALTGHGEAQAAPMMLSTIQTCNIAVEDLKLDGSSVPEDAAAVMICAPTEDITAAEANALLDYLGNGGKLLLMTDYMMSDMPNLERVAAYYGMKTVGGLVIDMTSGYSYSTDYPQYLQPDVSEHNVTATLFSYGAKPVVSYAGALERNTVARSGLTVTNLLTTSDAAYLKDAQVATTAEREEGDPVGAFTVAMAAEEGDARFVWFASGSFLSDTDISISSGANLFMLKDILGWMIAYAESESIPSENLVIPALQIPESIPASAAYAALFIPALAMLVIGLMCGRKKKA